MPNPLHPLPIDYPTSWSGQPLPRPMLTHLFPSCIVRLCIHNPASDVTEAIYFRITKIKDGTFWGTSLAIYRLADWVGMADGTQMTWRREHINEVPLGWQPKRFGKMVRGLEERMRGGRGRITGVA